MKRKSVVPPAVLFSFSLVGLCAGVYGIYRLDLWAMLVSIGWVILGMILAFVANFVLNRSR